MTDVIVVGEDAVTQAIAEKLIGYANPRLSIDRRDPIRTGQNRGRPIRGGQLQAMAPKYNYLGLPTLLLADLDTYDCPPSLITDWLDGNPVAPHLLLRVAYGEAESWLMADRLGFAGFLGIDPWSIPLLRRLDRRRNRKNIEPGFDLKPSLFLMTNLASMSPNNNLRRMLTPRERAKKGPGYNGALVPFIRYHWNIEAAARNSYSLTKAIRRISEFRWPPIS